MSTRTRITSALSVLVGSTLLASCSEEVTEQRSAAVRPVKLITIEQAAGQQSSRYPGVIAAARSSDLNFPVGGLLEQLLVIEAQEVEQGALLAQLDQRDFNSQAAAARAQFANAEEEYQRAVRLAAEDAIAQNVLEQRQAQRDVAQAQLESAEKALADTVLRAPFAGVIASVPASRLQTVQPGQTVMTLIGTDGLEARIDLPARVIAQSAARTDYGAFVILDAAPNNRIEASFKEATLIGDATSQTYAITFAFDRPDDLVVLPGMNATVELVYSPGDQEGTRVSAPLAAVMSDGTSHYVWVVDNESMTVSRRAVTIEEGIGETVVITGGLTPGETIAGAGASYLAEGMEVRPWTD